MSTREEVLAAVDRAEPVKVKPNGPGGRSPILTWAGEVLAQARRPVFLVHELLEAGTNGVWVGDYGTLKTFTLLDLELCIAAALPWHNRQVRPGWCAYIAAEGHLALGRRLAAWQVKSGVLVADVPLALSRRRVPMRQPEEPRRLRDELSSIADKRGEPPAVIGIDTLARNFGPGSESSPDDMQGWWDAVDDHLREPFGSTVITNHHVGHLEKGRYRGGSTLGGAADFIYLFERPSHDDLRVIVTCQKVKDMEPPAPFAVECETVPLLLEDGPAASLAVSEVEFDVSAAKVNAELTLGKNQKVILATHDRLLAEYRRNLIEAGRDPEGATVEVTTLRTESGLSRDRWRDAWQGLQDRRLFAQDGPIVVRL